jgi:protein-disulfide isomerase
MCFQCRKTHFMLRALVERHPERIRLVHRHFPMDHKVNPLVTEPMHVGAGKLALMAIGGAREGKFWETNDVLFSEAHGKETLSPRFVAEKLKIDPKVIAVALADPLVQMQLKIDIRDGIQLGLKGTPGFLVDGELYVGELPVKVLERFLRD